MAGAPGAAIENRASTGYTDGMKTAVSIPDGVFEDAEELAKRLRTSRSKLYAKALVQLIAKHDPDRVTDALNAVAEAGATNSDAFVKQASRRSFDRTEW